jgi:hypothetical protein
MTLRLALRSLAARPLRSAVLACGFGLGISVMANLLAIGDVILEQAQSPDLAGGGHLQIGSETGRVDNTRFLVSSVLGSPALAERTLAIAPSAGAQLYLVRDGRIVPVEARGGIPSKSRALGDPEIADVVAWRDTEDDRRFMAPDPGELLREMDRFHTIPERPGSVESWAEWLYFNGVSGDTRFYLTFLVGSEDSPGTRHAGVRLQLERNGKIVGYSQGATIDAAGLLDTAPDLTIANNSVRLVGTTYHVALDLPASDGRESRLTGELLLEATPGQSFPPFTIRGAGGWQTGYVVPVFSGSLRGQLIVGDERLRLDGGTGYHDHNWGFWRDVTWRWGQANGDDLSIVYGRVHPPADAADAARLPGFLVVLGPDGPLSSSTRVSIDEIDDPATGRPRSIHIRARGADMDLTIEIAVESAVVTRMDRGPWAPSDRRMGLLQMRGIYRVSGRVGERALDFEAHGSAETFRP